MTPFHPRLIPEPPCKHRMGGPVHHFGLWVCGVCWHKLEQRPKTYGPNPDFLGGIRGVRGSAPPQIIVWQAEHRYAHGNDINSFLKHMAAYFTAKGGVPETEAYDMALSIMQTLGETFGDADFDWTKAGAEEVAREEMTYWETDGDDRDSNGG